ncbi:MAG: hypothetical protein ABJE47_25425, partial [bacterium]
WQMLTGVSSLKVADSDEGVVAVSTRTADMLGKPCYMAVMVDGIQMNKLGTHLYVDLRQLPRPEEIHGIEVFSGASNIPLQYGGMGAGKTCGLIAIWTR